MSRQTINYGRQRYFQHTYLYRDDFVMILLIARRQFHNALCRTFKSMNWYAIRWLNQNSVRVRATWMQTKTLVIGQLPKTNSRKENNTQLFTIWADQLVLLRTMAELRRFFLVFWMIRRKVRMLWLFGDHSTHISIEQWTKRHSY